MNDLSVEGLVDRLRYEVTIGSGTVTALRREAAARITELEEAVEQAFRDGLAYGSNVENADPDIAWGHSRARAALGDAS